MKDFRLKTEDNRRKAFIRWFAWSVHNVDCDPAVWMTNYLNQRYEHNSEERLWLCWLYGNTYYLPTSWVLKNEFPDFECATYDRMKLWNDANYRRLRYQTDTKWSKGHLAEMFASYKEFVGDRTQKEAIESYYEGTPEKNFDSLWAAFNKKLYKFGRYSNWFYMQHLKQTADVDIEPTSLMLDDDSGSRSHRNGLLLALGLEEFYDRKLTPTMYKWLEQEAEEILAETRERYPHKDMDFFMMETALCSFKKIFREHHGRYLGYYLDRQSEEIQRLEEDGWLGIEWNVLWQSRNETVKNSLVGRRKIDVRRFSEFMRTGRILDINEEFNYGGPMNRVIAIGGVPATGKTTLMRRILKEWGPFKQIEPTIDGVKLPMLVDEQAKLHILGKYDEGETFAGTDRLSMSIQPTAVKFVQTTDGVLLFEGDRLFNISFLKSCQKVCNTKIVCLEADAGLIEERHHIREDNQSAKFKKGRQTKIDNIKAEFDDALFGSEDFETFSNNTPNDQDYIISHVKNLVDGA
jgi:hypothetical protein